MRGKALFLGGIVLAAVAAHAQTAERPPAAIAIGQEVAGEITPNDVQRRSGKYEDGFTFTGTRGQRVELRLASADFDAFVLVTGPGGYALSNDDGESGSTDSALVLELPADGTYRVAATTFRPGATGGYRLRLSPAPASARASAPEPATPLQVGAPVAGRLQRGDGRLGSGEYVDRYRFTGRRGQRVTIDLSSSEFDTYLMLRRPDGSQDDVDDSRIDDRASTNSRIDTVLADDGEYDLLVTSYAADETGRYQLTMRPSAGHPRHVNVAGGPRVIALLVGVSDYGGRTSNLPNTDADARQLGESLRAAGLLHPASVTLTNGEATVERVQAAFNQIERAAGPSDLFLFFFSGHGDQVDVEARADELDGRSETIELYDEAVSDTQLGRMFGKMGGRMALVAIDACYAGGFRNLVSRPNVMGLFSSEEDLTSLVADRFKAGGFLSYFLRSGLGGEADDDGDRIITSGELATYVRRRFRREGDIPAQTREDERNFQNLVIERGGVHIEDALVRLAGAASPRLPGQERARTFSGADRKQPGARGKMVARPLL